MANLSRDTIFATCDDILFSNGRIATYEDIRGVLGGGSNATISRYRREWEATLAQRIDRATQRPEIPEPVWNACTALWDAAVASARQVAQSEFAGARADAEREIEAANVRWETAQTKFAAAQGQVDELNDRLDRGAQVLAQVNASLARLREEHAAVRARLDEANARTAEALAQVSALRGEATELRNAAAADRAALIGAQENESARWQREMDSVRARAALDAKSAAEREQALRSECAKLSDTNIQAFTALRDQKAATASAERLAAQTRAELETALARMAESESRAYEARAAEVKAREDSERAFRERNAAVERLAALAEKKIEGRASKASPRSSRKESK